VDGATVTLTMKRATQMPREPVYQKLAKVIEGLITTRSLRPGDRVPSVRQFSRQQRVSVPTALQAFATLETRGLIEARPKSGFYVRVRRANSVPEPSSGLGRVVLKITDFAKSDPMTSLFADQSNATLVHLGLALPCPSLLPGIKLARTMAAIARRLGADGTSYDMAPGSEILRRELARRSMEWGCALQPEDFLVTVGATEAVSLALRATCQPGDTVAVESPTYFGFASLLRELRLRALPIPVDSAEGMDLEALRRALRRTRVAACLSIPNFHNPVGCLMPDDRKRELLEILQARQIPLVEDDIYGDLQHEGVRPRCIKAFDTEGATILCSSYSKTLAPGYRVGFVAAGRWHAKVLALKQVSTLAGPTLPVLAVAEFVRNGGYDRYLRSIRQTYHQQVERMREAIVGAFPEGIRLSRPLGGFALWCELPKKVDSMELAKRARAAGISIAPGPMFSADGSFQNFVRINCGFPWDTKIERSVHVLGHLVAELCR
jgi:DNA-binding transcriptional MocR family regulator